MTKQQDVLLKRADYEFQDSQRRLSESNSLIKTFLGFSGAIASFMFYTKVYDALFLISGIAVVFGFIWLEDQVKMHRKMFTKKSILKEILDKQYKKYEPVYSRSLLDAWSYLLSGFIAFIILGTLPSMFYSMKFLVQPSFMSSILNNAFNPILINSYWFNQFYVIFTSLFTIYFTYVIVGLGLDKKNVKG